MVAWTRSPLHTRGPTAPDPHRDAPLSSARDGGQASPDSAASPPTTQPLPLERKDGPSTSLGAAPSCGVDGTSIGTLAVTHYGGEPDGRDFMLDADLAGAAARSRRGKQRRCGLE
jgi:hypothetical protein